MDFRRITLAATRLRTLAWSGDDLVDWVMGRRYKLDGTTEHVNVGNAYRFDASTGCDAYAVKYENFGTKGVVMRDTGLRDARGGHRLDFLREIDRRVYHADAYCFPALLFRAFDGRVLLAHCPREYKALDLETPEGECLTPRPVEDASDVFHSRLDASLDGRWLLSNGWVWHPWGVACVYDVARALAEPAYLSTDGERIDLGDDFEGDVQGAAFAGERLVCITAEDGPALSVFDLRTREVELCAKLDEAPGTRLMALDDDHVALFDGHPRVLQLSTGKVVERWDDLDGGRSLYQPSTRQKPVEPPHLACDPANGRFALGYADRIVVVSRV